MGGRDVDRGVFVLEEFRFFGEVYMWMYGEVIRSYSNGRFRRDVVLGGIVVNCLGL